MDLDNPENISIDQIKKLSIPQLNDLFTYFGISIDGLDTEKSYIVRYLLSLSDATQFINFNSSAVIPLSNPTAKPFNRNKIYHIKT
jgi:hypothetical protein